MQNRKEIEKRIRAFKVKNAISLQDEHVVAAIHLVNEHQVDVPIAQDHTSPGSSDHGIDAWHYVESKGSLIVYQSKLSNSRSTVTAGFLNLIEAADWLAQVLSTGELGETPKNPCICNLVQLLSEKKESIHTICFRLVSPFDHNELDDYEEFENARRSLASSALNKYGIDHDIKLKLEVTEYNLEEGGIPTPVCYTIPFTAENSIVLASNTRLDLLTTTLHGLVELYRKRGDNLFEKNLRLYLDTPEARRRVEHPMAATLDMICGGKLEPIIFPFYHVGVTLAARSCELGKDRLLALESPYVINGCQTINIASHYLRGLEKAKAEEKIARFKQIPVVAKIVTRASDEQLREIAICNNRQNPIAPWQLFSNDRIHIEIEAALHDVGVFYERQSGKFDAMMTKLQTVGEYPNTNKSFITVEGLGQIICLCRRQLALAAKPSVIFSNKETHDKVFDRSIPHQPQDVVWAWNAHKSAVRGLTKYLYRPAHDNEQSHRIFVKPNVKQAMHFIAMRHLYQRRRDLSEYYVWRLNKIAPPGLVEEVESFYRQVVLKTKAWYLRESKNLTIDVSIRSLESFLAVVGTEVGLGSDGPMPFTDNILPWPDREVTEEKEGRVDN